MDWKPTHPSVDFRPREPHCQIDQPMTLPAPRDKPDWLTGTSLLKGPLLLVILQEGPCHAHEAAVRLRRRLGPAALVDPDEIYPMLKRLHEKDVLGAYYGPNPNDPRKRVLLYCANERTAGALAEWLQMPVSREPYRSDLLVRFVLMGEDQASEIARFLDEYERDCAAAASMHGRKIPTESWLGFLMERVRLAVVACLQAELDWIEETRAALGERLNGKA